VDDDDPIADLVKFWKENPEIWEEFLESHKRDNRYFWQRAWWKIHLWLFLLKMKLFGGDT